MSDLCTLCQAVEAGPYCPVSGVVHRAFAIGDHYEVQESLGPAMATLVFGARDQQHGRSVAAALVASHLTGEQVAAVRAAQERFVREMAALDTQNRERAVGIIDFGWDDALGVTYLVTCRVDDPMLRPTLDEVDAALRALDESASMRETAPALASQTALDLPAMIGSYDVISSLGAGGTGRVYLGQHPLIGSKVAIKVLLPEIARSAETVDRFIQEARASSQIASPHIPRYFDFGTTADGLPYAIMEYFEGETLGVRLGRTGTLSIGETAQVVEQVASALLMAHEAGLVHRDLKPDNILLVSQDTKSKSAPIRAAGSSADLGRSTGKSTIEVKVLDFGIAKVVGNRSPNRTLTGSFLGTPYYCAPEQVFGHEVDARTDVYSLGATAFEMLTGAPPFVGAVPVILSSKATEDAPDLAKRGVPPRVAYTIRRMLAREPRHRAPSMAWVLDQVATWLTPGELGEVDISTDRVTREEPTVVDWSPEGARAAAIATGSSEGLSSTTTTTTSDAIRAVSPPRGVRTWLTLAVAASALAIGGAVILLSGTARSTASTTSPKAASPNSASPNSASPNSASPNSASPNGASPNGASPNAASPNAASPNAASPSAASPNAGSPNAGSPNAASPNTASPNAASPNGASPSGGSPNATSPNAASPNTASQKAGSPNAASQNGASQKAGSPSATSPNNASPSGGTGPQRPSAGDARPGKPEDSTARPGQRRPPRSPEKKPGKKPPSTKPADTKDVLIVDPFSSPRSDTP